MMISGVNNYSSNLFQYASVSSSSSSSSNVSGTGASGRPEGPPPGGGGGGGGRGPKVDTNSDSVWDADELTALADQLTESGETSFDASEVMSTYDTDGNQVLDDSERSALRENNAFNLSDMQKTMAGNSRPPKPMNGGGSEVSGVSGASGIDEILNSLIDEDEDSLWSLDELSDFSDLLESVSGTSVDSEELLEKYDTDGDGYLSAAEREAMKADDAFQLAPDEVDETQEESVTDRQKVVSAISAYAKQSQFSDYMSIANTSNMQFDV